jgi:hypothetical protein
MNDDVPKPPPQYVIERSFIRPSPMPEEKKNPFHEPARQAENYGGQFVTASGTSNTSFNFQSTPVETYIKYIPEFFPLPEEELQKQRFGKNMEIITKLSKTNK